MGNVPIPHRGGGTLLPLKLTPSRREEQAVLGKELESTKAELLDLQLKRDKVSWCSADITESKMRLQELADCLRVALQEEVGALPWGQGRGAGPGRARHPWLSMVWL